MLNTPKKLVLNNSGLNELKLDHKISSYLVKSDEDLLNLLNIFSCKNSEFIDQISSGVRLTNDLSKDKKHEEKSDSESSDSSKTESSSYSNSDSDMDLDELRFKL